MSKGDNVVAVASRYFSEPKPNYKFIHSGSILLDCVLGGGYAIGRVSNIVGDKAVGKTLCAIEACANFNKQYGGYIRYCETEAAFEDDYAEALGMPVDAVDFGDPDDPVRSAEDFYDDMADAIREIKASGQPGLYVLDSVDALSDEAELEADINKGTFAMGKQKKLSQFFRKYSKDLGQSETHLMLVSQVRENIGAMFGEKYRRSGGKALDFYTSQIVWLHNMGTTEVTRRGIKRANAVKVRAKCKKNKVGMPFRQCEFTIRFGFGIDDLKSIADFAIQLKAPELLSCKTITDLENISKNSMAFSSEEYRDKVAKAAPNVISTWYELEEEFLPTIKKY